MIPVAWTDLSRGIVIDWVQQWNQSLERFVTMKCALNWVATSNHTMGSKSGLIGFLVSALPVLRNWFLYSC